MSVPGALAVLAFSLVLLVMVTWLCLRAGLMDDARTQGVGPLLTLLAYTVFWGLPTAVALDAWATWWRGG